MIPITVEVHTERRSGYTMISNNFAHDARLSFKARGLGLYLLVLTDTQTEPTSSIMSIARDNRCGLDQVRSGLSELEEHGYLTREWIRHRGTVTGIRYVMTCRTTGSDHR